MEDDPDAIARQIGLGEVGNELTDLLKPERLLDILRNFSLFSSGKGGRRIKVIPRFQQYEGANKIVERVKEGWPAEGTHLALPRLRQVVPRWCSLPKSCVATRP